MAYVVTQQHLSQAANNTDEFQKKYTQLIGKVWADADFKKKLLADPTATLKAEGFDIPSGINVKIVENTPDTIYYALPLQEQMQLSDAQLDHISGGAQSTASTACTTPSCTSSASSAC